MVSYSTIIFNIHYTCLQPTPSVFYSDSVHISLLFVHLPRLYLLLSSAALRCDFFRNVAHQPTCKAGQCCASLRLRLGARPGLVPLCSNALRSPFGCRRAPSCATGVLRKSHLNKNTAGYRADGDFVPKAAPDRKDGAVNLPGV